MELYYRDRNGITQGPLAWDAIKAAYHAGRISAEAAVSVGADGPWVPAATVEQHGVEVLSKSVVVRTVTAAAPDVDHKPVSRTPPFAPPVLSIFLDALGGIGFIGCAICFVFAFSTNTWIWAGFGLSGLVSAGMCMATGRILATVAEIKWRMERK